MSDEQQIGFAKEEIMHGCDGPLTRFVLISRAVKLAAKNKFSSDAVANGLSEALEAIGDFDPGIIIPTGS